MGRRPHFALPLVGALLVLVGRVRDVRRGPDGFVHLAIDDDIGDPTPVVRLEPVGS